MNLSPLFQRESNETINDALEHYEAFVRRSKIITTPHDKGRKILKIKIKILLLILFSFQEKRNKEKYNPMRQPLHLLYVQHYQLR